MKNHDRGKRYSKQEIVNSIELVMSGYKLRHVARMIGCDHSTINYWLRLYKGFEKDEAEGLKSKI